MTATDLPGVGATQASASGTPLGATAVEACADVEGALSGQEARLRAVRTRAKLNALIRQFFAQRDVLEVETPILSQAGNTDPNIESFHTDFSGHADAGGRWRWLRTSPEFPIKRLLAAGIGDCYELGRVFRNGEAGARHNPEFTMLEWYRLGWDHHRLMAEVAMLIDSALLLVDRRVEHRVLTYRDWFLDALQIDPHLASIEALQSALTGTRIDGDGLSRDDWLDLLITHRLQPCNPDDRLLFVYDYPASQCALARVRDANPPVSERFETYLGARELANGYHELNDAVEQRVRFARDLEIRKQRGALLPDIDTLLLDALPQLPDCAGVALGVDRLLMCVLGIDDIRELLAFDFASA